MLPSMIVQQKLRDLGRFQRRLLGTKMPKFYRFTLCAEIQNTLREIQRLISRAKKRYYKKTTLEDIDVHLDFLRELILEAHEDDLTSVTDKDLSLWIGRVDEIGSIAGAWLKTEKVKQEKSERVNKS